MSCSPTQKDISGLKKQCDQLTDEKWTEGICDQCEGELIIRKDDAAETVRHRLEVYHTLTEVLKDFYAARDKLRLVEGNQSIERANQEILKAIGVKV